MLDYLIIVYSCCVILLSLIVFLVCFGGYVCCYLLSFACRVCGYLWFLLLAGVYFRLRLLGRLLYAFLLGFGCLA